MSMSIEEAIRILDPETSADAIAEIKYYAGFNKEKAIEKVEEACILACDIMREYLKMLLDKINNQSIVFDVDKVIKELEKLADESYKAYCIAFNSDDRAEYDAYTNAIEIVKEMTIN